MSETVKYDECPQLGIIIKRSRIAAGLSAQELAELMGVTKNAVYNWEAGSKRPDIRSVPRLCKVLRISADAFFEMSADERTAMSQDEQRHMTNYRMLSERDRTIVDALMDSMMTNKEEKLRERTVSLFTRIRYSGLSMSAGGVGEPLQDSRERSYLYLRDSELVRRADEVILVNGDSMSGTYEDDDLLLVRHTNQIPIGSTGVFVLNGEGFVKEWAGDRLISHNKAYAPILIGENDDFRCVGAVLGKVTADMLPEADEKAMLGAYNAD